MAAEATAATATVGAGETTSGAIQGQEGHGKQEGEEKVKRNDDGMIEEEEEEEQEEEREVEE